MNQHTTLSAIVSALLLTGLPAAAQAAPQPTPHAQPVAYRCELSPAQLNQGHAQVLYQSTPCNPGSTPEKALHAQDQRTDSQRTSSDKAHQSEMRLARRLERERIKSERQSALKPAMSLSPGRKVVQAAATTPSARMKVARPFTARTPKNLKAPAYRLQTTVDASAAH
ncbi:MAG: hypothetical protein V4532_08640 [Pseudomonadota bacterium]